MLILGIFVLSCYGDPRYLHSCPPRRSADRSLAAASRSSGRGRRAALDVEDSDAAFALLASTEPAQCYRRLICDLATGAMPRSENDVILSLFDKDAPIESQRFEFASAAKLGKQVQSVQLCEVRYSCPLTGSQIQQLVA